MAKYDSDNNDDILGSMGDLGDEDIPLLDPETGEFKASSGSGKTAAGGSTTGPQSQEPLTGRAGAGSTAGGDDDAEKTIRWTPSGEEPGAAGQKEAGEEKASAAAGAASAGGGAYTEAAKEESGKTDSSGSGSDKDSGNKKKKKKKKGHGGLIAFLVILIIVIVVIAAAAALSSSGSSDTEEEVEETEEATETVEIIVTTKTAEEEEAEESAEAAAEEAAEETTAESAAAEETEESETAEEEDSTESSDTDEEPPDLDGSDDDSSDDDSSDDSEVASVGDSEELVAILTGSDYTPDLVYVNYYGEDASSSSIQVDSAMADSLAAFIAAAQEQGYGTMISRCYYDSSDSSGEDSDHATGLAVDLVDENAQVRDTFGSSDTYAEEREWLADNAADYGFILRYPEGKEDVTGVEAVTYHFVFVGTEAAQEMAENDWCLEEYVAQSGEE